MHYGLMTEEINYCYDGGLYAELVRNRAAAPAATNTLAEPVNVVPVVTKLSDLAPTLTHEIAPHSITLLELKAR